MRKYKMNPRGLGTSSGKCFVCGRQITHENFASFVPSIETGEAIMVLFKTIGCFAKLDYRESEPNWIQIKIVGCQAHNDCIKFLHEAVSRNEMINAAIIIEALKTC